MRVLGIDPGSHVTGWGLVEAVPGGARHVASGVSMPRSRGSARRLGELADSLDRLLDEWRPDAVAMERAFMGRNAMSALKLGEVRGALLAVAGRRGIDVVDYPPATVKVAVAGSGRQSDSCGGGRRSMSRSRPASRATRPSGVTTRKNTTARATMPISVPTVQANPIHAQ